MTLGISLEASITMLAIPVSMAMLTITLVVILERAEVLVMEGADIKNTPFCLIHLKEHVFQV